MHLGKLTDVTIIVNEETFTRAHQTRRYSSPTPWKWVMLLKLR